MGGSPPQVRGKRCIHCIIPHSNGITPAGAGKTSLFRCRRMCCRDHPRRCGENVVRAGSSIAVSRITPAGAGKTPRRRLPPTNLRDHPRRCGENPQPLLSATNVAGSPPQVRGKPPSGFWVFLPFRITPAGAGKTATAILHSSRLQDHPRRCGENKS